MLILGTINGVAPINRFSFSPLGWADIVRKPKSRPASRGAFFVTAGLTAHIQYGAGSTAPMRLMGATPTTGTKLKAPPRSSRLLDGAFFCLIQTS